jgi:glycosyltransferase involved in cell wall biosynthesis
MKEMKILVGIPAFNEEKNIGSIIIKLEKMVDGVIVCNDGSSDLTGIIAEKLGATVINHPKNLGYGGAINSIFTKAKEMDADILVTFDADGQHRFEDIKKILEPIKKEQANMVIGSRFLGNSETVPGYRKIGIKIITKISNLETDSKITDSQSGLRAYDKKTIQSLNLTERGMGISTEILIKANNLKLKIVEVPIKIIYSGNTSTHNAASHGISVIISTMKFISIEHPLKFYGIPGLMLLFLGLFFAIWTVNEFSKIGSFPIHVALIAIGTILSGALLTITSILLYSLVNVVREKRG